MSPPDFFIGWDRRSGRSQFGFLAAVAALVLVLLAGLGVLTGASLPDANLGAFRLTPPDAPEPPAGGTTLTGSVSLLPVPTLFVMADAPPHRPHAVLLSGDGKRGPALDPALTDGAIVTVTGLLLKRGTIDMMVVDGMVASRPGAPVAVPAAVSLGRWRIAGEICDGKCQTGAMRPGQGIAHRACASLCLEGGVPPVFVAVSPVAGASFLLLAGPNGAALPDPGRLAALRLVLEGDVERRGDVLIFKVDLSRAQVL